MSFLETKNKMVSGDLFDSSDTEELLDGNVRSSSLQLDDATASSQEQTLGDDNTMPDSKTSPITTVNDCIDTPTIAEVLEENKVLVIAEDVASSQDQSLSEDDHLALHSNTSLGNLDGDNDDIFRLKPSSSQQMLAEDVSQKRHLGTDKEEMVSSKRSRKGSIPEFILVIGLNQDF